MKRKVVRLGPSTLVMSLPSQWVQQRSIKPGDELTVEESMGGLHVAIGERKPHKESVTLSVANYSKDDVKVVLTHLYRMGASSIRLENVSSQLMPEISTIVQDLLLGFEITEREEATCVLDSVSEPSDDKFESLLRRVFLIIKETHQFVEDSCRKNKFDLTEITQLRKQHDRYVMFCKRVIMRKSSNSSLIWELLTFLMHIEHAYYYMYIHLAERKPKLNNTIFDLLAKLRDYYELLYEAYFKKDVQFIHKITALKSHQSIVLQQLEKSQGAQSVMISFIRELFRLIQICSSPILALILSASSSER